MGFAITTLRRIKLVAHLLCWACAVYTVASFAGSIQVSAQGVVIRAIQVSGNKRVEPETVRSYLRFKVGDRYDALAVDDSLKTLFGTGLFADVDIDLRGSTVVISVVENPIIRQVAFEGNAEVEDDSLSSEVQLKSRSIYTRARVQADVQRILSVYRRQGLFAVTVEPKIIQLDQNRVDLVFEINEGPSTKVRSINFIGNSAFSDSTLRDVITTQRRGWLSFLKNDDIYDPDRLNLDRELIRQYYLKNGYADVQVLSGVADLDRDGRGFFITFTVEEGQLYTFGDVRVENNIPDIDTGALEAELLTRPGDVYNAALVDKSSEKITLKVAELGYAFARVRPRADRDPVGRVIGLTYVVEEGPRVYIERINVSGNTRTRDAVIRREFRLAEGDAYNRLLVDRARRRLRALGFFKKVDVRNRRGSAGDRVVLDVVVEEQSTGELSFGGGYSTSEGVIGDVSITERNLLGRGQYLRLKFSGSIERFQVDLSFTEPRFLDRNLSAGFDIYHKEVDFSSQSSFKSRKTGAGLRLGFPITDGLWMNTRYTFSRETLFDVQDDASRATREAAGCLNVSCDGIEATDYVSSVGYTLSYDTRNNRREPTRGLYLTVSQDAAGVGGDVNYIRTLAEGRGYYPITEKITLVGRLIGGHIAGWGGDDVRLLDSFYKGGETVRGFKRSGYGPRDGNGDALGGTLFYGATAAVRFPLPFMPDELGMGGAVFADAGSLFDVGGFGNELVSCSATVTSNCLNDDSTIRASVGASLLWKSPVGPLRADFAYVLSDEDYDKQEQFRFGASTKF